MKTIKFLIFSAFIALFIACNKEDNMRSDAKEFAKLTCESIQLMGKAMEGDAAAQARLEELSDKMEKKGDELDAKYQTQEEKQKLGEMILEESGDCQ